MEAYLEIPELVVLIRGGQYKPWPLRDKERVKIITTVVENINEVLKLVKKDNKAKETLKQVTEIAHTCLVKRKKRIDYIDKTINKANTNSVPCAVCNTDKERNTALHPWELLPKRDSGMNGGSCCFHTQQLHDDALVSLTTAYALQLLRKNKDVSIMGIKWLPAPANLSTKSCLKLSPAGCLLPRTWRPIICNWYTCSSLEYHCAKVTNNRFRSTLYRKLVEDQKMITVLKVDVVDTIVRLSKGEV